MHSSIKRITRVLRNASSSIILSRFSFYLSNSRSTSFTGLTFLRKSIISGSLCLSKTDRIWYALNVPRVHISLYDIPYFVPIHLLYCIVFYSTVLQIIIIINYYISRRVLRCRVWICFLHRDSTRSTCRRHLDQLYFETTSIIKQRRFFILDRVINEHVPHLGKHACSLPVNG